MRVVTAELLLMRVRIGGFCSTLQLSAVRKIHRCPKLSPGRPVNKDFEKLVVSLALSQSSSRTVRGAKVYPCLAMVQRAASEVLRRFPEYLECPIVQRLKFSFRWASGIFKRCLDDTSSASRHTPEPSQTHIKQQLNQDGFVA